MDESESEAEVGGEDEKQEEMKEAKSTASHKYTTTAVMAPSGIKAHQRSHSRSTEEVVEAEEDVPDE